MPTTTRWYFDPYDAADVAPPPAAAWTSPTPSLDLALTTARPPHTPVAPFPRTHTRNESSAAPQVLRNYVGVAASGLLTGPLSGTFRAAIPGTCNTGANGTLRVIVRVVSADGATVRGTLCDLSNPSIYDRPSDPTQVRTVQGAITPVTALAGDRIVVEVGQAAGNTSTSNFAYMIRGNNITGPSAVDCAFSDVIFYTDNEHPWVELILNDPPPNAPASLVVTDTTATTITVAWTPPATGPAPTSYDVSVVGGGTWTVDDSVLTYQFTGLLPVTTYDLQVTAVNASGSGPAATVEGTTDPLDYDARWWTHRLAASLGLDPTAAQPVVQVQTWTGAAWVTDADLSNALAGYQVTYGRNDVRGDVDAIRATLTLATVRVPATPAIATRVRVRLSDAVAAAMGLADPVRFTGEVTDPLVDHGARLTKLVCVGRLGRAYRQPVASTGWPVETDADRIGRILAGAGIDIPVGTIDAGTVTLAAATADTTAARLVEQVTASTSGQLVEQPDGAVDWHGPEHRRGTVPALTLAAAAVFRAITWSQRMADLVNRVTVKVAAGAQYTVEMPWSVDPVAGFGPYPASVDTILTSELDARTLAARIVARRFIPCWQLPDLQVDLTRTLPLAQLPTVLELRHGDRVELSGLPAGCPVPTRVFVEGWTETATPRAWRWSATVSDPIQSGVSVRWMDVPQTGARTWADVDPTLTWLDALRIENPDDLFTP